MPELVLELNRLAGTTRLTEVQAANVWAGTTGLTLVQALRVKAAKSVEAAQCLNSIAGTTGLPEPLAASRCS